MAQSTEPKCQLLLKEKGRRVSSVAFSPDNRILAASVNDSWAREVKTVPHITLWDCTTRKQIATLAGQKDTTTLSFAFSPDGKTIVSVDSNGTLFFWNIATRNALTVKTGEDISYVAFSQDGRMLIAATSPDSNLPKVLFWDVGRRQISGRIATNMSRLWSLACSSKSSRFAASGWDNKGKQDRVQIWDSQEKRLLNQWSAPSSKDLGSSLAISSNGEVLAKAAWSSGRDDHVTLYDCNTKKQLKALHAGSLDVRRLAFSPTDRFLAAAAGEAGHAFYGELVIWDVASGHRRVWLKLGLVQIDSLAFSPDGKLLAAGGKKGQGNYNKESFGVVGIYEMKELKTTKPELVGTWD